MIKSLIKGLDLNINSSISYESLPDIREKLNYYRLVRKDLLLGKLNESEIKSLEEDVYAFLTPTIGLFTSLDSSNQSLFRATINRNITGDNINHLMTVSQIIGPPVERSVRLRCNIKNSPMFYASFDPKASLFEINPNDGDLITITEWRIKKDQNLNSHIIYHPDVIDSPLKEWFNKLKLDVNPELWEIYSEVLKFFTEEYIKKVPNDISDNYIFSSIHSDKIINSNDGNLDTIIYPSIKMLYKSINLAINNSVISSKLDLIGIYSAIVSINYYPNSTERKSLQLNDFCNYTF